MKMLSKIIPITARPIIFALRNHWFHHSSNYRVYLRDFFAALICIVVMTLLYIATRDLLVKLGQLAEYVYLPSQYILTFILLALFFMLLVSNAIIASGAFFMSFDLDLLRKAPLRNFQFFLGRFTYVSLLSSWMPLLFLFPCLLAFALYFKASITIYALALLLLIPYFLIASAMAYSCLLVILWITRPQWRFLLLWTLFLLLLALVVSFIRLISQVEVGFYSAQDFARLVTVLSLPDYYWLPSHWIGVTLGYLLEKNSINSYSEVILLYSSSVSTLSLTYILHYLLYNQALEHAQAKGTGGRSNRVLFSKLHNYFRVRIATAYACWQREWRTIKRDLSHVIQTIVLLSISIVYLYHLSVFRAVESLPINLRSNWKQLLFIGHICMSSFIVTAICTRFVFSSVSLEGRAFWLIETSPIALRKFLKYKFVFWFVPVCFLSALFFTAGASVIGAPFKFIILNGFIAILVCYSLVGLGIGCGALFANFNWEYSSQLAASFGSLIYMVLCILVICLSIVPAAGLIWIYNRSDYFSSVTSIAAYLLCTTSLLLLHYSVNQLALKLGTQALKNRKL